MTVRWRRRPHGLRAHAEAGTTRLRGDGERRGEARGGGRLRRQRQQSIVVDGERRDPVDARGWLRICGGRRRLKARACGGRARKAPCLPPRRLRLRRGHIMARR